MYFRILGVDGVIFVYGADVAPEGLFSAKLGWAEGALVLLVPLVAEHVHPQVVGAQKSRSELFH